MKKFNILTLGLALLIFAGCEKETTGGLSRVTNYPIFTVSGDNPLFLPLGTAYNEPGATAKEGDDFIDVETVVNGDYRGGSTLDENVSDRYQVTYSAENKDGFTGSASRTVYVVETGDLVNSISGLYTSTIVRNGVPRFSNLKYVLVWENTDGTYGMSCGIGAYYEIGTAYGLGFNAPASITANDISSNDFTIPTFQSAYGGWPWAMNTTDLTVDAGAKKINMTTVWDIGYTFEVELTQVQI